MSNRYTVKVSTIDPAVPAVCVGCLNDTPSIERNLVFRRSDGAIERVSAVQWPYCSPCHNQLAELDRTQRAMTAVGAAQMIIVIYAVVTLLWGYDFWWPAAGILAVFFGGFIVLARRARILWDLEWARIDDVYKGGIGAAYSFRNRDYAGRFAALNGGDGGASTTAAATAAD